MQTYIYIYSYKYIYRYIYIYVCATVWRDAGGARYDLPRLLGRGGKSAHDNCGTNGDILG